MPFETPDQLSNDEITILKKESETTEKTDLMKDIFANRGKYIQFNLEKDYYLSRTKNEIAKRYIGGLFDAVIQKYLQEIQQMLGEKPVNTTTATKTDEDLDDRRAGKNVKKISLEKYPDNWLKEPVSLFDYQEYNREKVSTKHQIDIRNLFLSGIDQFELFSDANEFSRITTNVPGTEYAVSARL